jgi:hypothetical protein
MPQSGEKVPIVPLYDSYDPRVGPIRIYQTVSLGNTVNKGEKELAAYNHRRTEDL